MSIFLNYCLESNSDDWKQRPLVKLQSRKDVTTKHVPEKHHDSYGSGRKTYPIRNGNKQKAAISYLDAKINEIQESLPNIISKAKITLKEELQFNRFKKNSQGWSIVTAGIIDIYGDFLSNEQQINDTAQLFTYGFLFFYGLGFGLPLVLSSPPAGKFNCGVNDYYSSKERYGINYDITDLVHQVCYHRNSILEL